MKEITMPAHVDSIAEITDLINEELEEHGCPLKTLTQIDIAVDEIFSNIAFYAYGGGTGEAKVAVSAHDGLAEIVFSDSGKPYDPLTASDPDVTLSAEERKIGGLGIFIVRKTMDEVTYEYRGGMNVLTVKKRFREPMEPEKHVQ